ncbi:hypothetical protein GOB94_12915 [Granulicella sp. 5B5]|uniref:hypothetical protein n=1 Tax=Granulicella sp. 5B5 TaxID=1617967 RepID=UPI0015F50C92|nr:hypothetical protein [Granulicella sp. 5B5]QMV19487.1 hypothetical protein GOB94_12915 [Granulicella sp. 5B5]
MQIHKKALSLSPLLIATLVGCGSTSLPSSPPSTPPSTGLAGKVVQGAVSGSTVWADSLASGTRFVIDSAELSTQTTTDSTGAFTIKATPTYKYVIVSQGGTDTITGKTADTLLSPGGAQTVSPLTTLVALDTSGNLASTINALLPAGTTFDSDLTATGGLTPAAMVLLTSITTAVTSFDATIQSTASSSSATLTAQQINNINLALYSQMAIQFATLPSTSLSNTATLATNMQTSLSTAIATIATNNTNITLQNPSTLAATIANNSVATAANVVGNATGDTNLQGVTASNVQTTGVPASTSSAVTELTVMSSGSNTQIVNSTITSVVSSTAGSVTVTSTPSSYSPPPIPIVNNPTVIGYQLVVAASGNQWNVSSFTITFSDDMIATASGGSNYAHSVLNPANYQFSQPGCTPSSYASNVVTFTCSSLQSGNFTVTILKSSSNGGVLAGSTSLGLLVDNTKIFTLPAATGSTGGSSLSLF